MNMTGTYMDFEDEFYIRQFFRKSLAKALKKLGERRPSLES